MKILIVQMFLAHYRRDFFDSITQNESIQAFLASSINDDVVKHYIPRKNFFHLEFVSFVFLGHRFVYQRGLLKLLRRGDYSHIVFPGIDFHYINIIPITIFSFLSKKSLIFWGHHDYEKNSSFLRFFKIFLLRFSTGCLTYSVRGKKNLLRFCPSYPGKIIVLGNSLNLSSTPNKLNLEKKFELFSASKILHLVFVGRIVPNKKLDVVFHSLVFLLESNIPIKFSIVGSGSLLSYYKELAVSLGLSEHVHFYGEIYDDYVLTDIFSRSECMIFPGKIGLGAVHALGHGLPIFADSNEDVHSPEFEILNDKNSVFFNGSSYDLAKKIQYYYSLSISERLSLAKNCYASFLESNYNNDIMVKNFFSFFNDCN
jgi:glycosyltransferase involved in cell wall biosynthesis